MFTGIVEGIAKVVAADRDGNDMRLTVDCTEIGLSDVCVGDSVAFNGVCLTVAKIEGDCVMVDLSAETLSCTTFGHIEAGVAVNVEKSLLPTTRIGGHFVSGHVDGIAYVQKIQEAGISQVLTIKVPDRLKKYIAAKGSVCIDGVSLTVNQVIGDEMCINIIPHTLDNTIIGNYQEGAAVNIEVDIIARYLERLLHGSRPEQTHARVEDVPSTIDRQLLKDAGFLG